MTLPKGHEPTAIWIDEATNLPDGSTPGGMTWLCEWFAACKNEAVKARPHPILGDVPICQRCDDLVERLS